VVRALDRVDLHFVDGDRVGLLGHNGAGKTTMLRVMAGIYEPTEGTITTDGAVTPFFTVTEGLDIDATGYEAIRLRGRMLGRSNKEVAETAQEIASFTELGDYLHMPLRTYSSGMLVRLAFAIATSQRPEILLMDEAIGAGDAAFVSRAQARLKEFIAASGIMVVATHNVDILRRWCNKAILLAHGRIAAEGPIEEVIAEHQRLAEGG
jgi:ABC-type polysaccharide/polyol phosphate transport system ATPase subunit